MMANALEFELRHLDLDHARVGPRSPPADHDPPRDVLEQLIVKILQPLDRCPAHPGYNVDHGTKCMDEADGERIHATPGRRGLDQSADQIVDGEHCIDLLPDQAGELASKDRRTL